MRRVESTRLHPLIDRTGVRRFKASDVERLAKEMQAEQRTPRNAQPAVVRAAEMPKGELAALVFERLEQRHSLSEIVIALRVPPEDVRELYHTWLVGLWAGELQHKEPALPARHTDQDAIRRVTPVQLAQLLAALPAKQSTRISIARMLGECVIPDGPGDRRGLRRVPQPLRVGWLRTVRPDHDRSRRDRGSRTFCRRRLQNPSRWSGSSEAQSTRSLVSVQLRKRRLHNRRWQRVLPSCDVHAL